MSDQEMASADVSARVEELERSVASLQEAIKERDAASGYDANKMSIVVFSGEMDKLLAALVIANGAASMGMDTHMFFTFWGTAALRARRGGEGRTIKERMLGWMLPVGGKGLKLSRMNMGGLGPAMIRRTMQEKNVTSLEELMEMAKEQDVHIHVCDMSMDLLGIRMDELIEYPEMEQCGVATFLQASSGGQTLFI